MGRERPDMMDIDRVTKKKVSEDKVTKHEGKHHRKHVRHIRSEDSDDESSKGSIDQEGGASLFQRDDDQAPIHNTESKEAKKQHVKGERLRGEALRRAEREGEGEGEGSGPSSSAPGLQVQTEAERKKKKKTEKRNARRTLERQMAKQAAASALDGLASTGADDSLMSDVESTSANPAKPKPAPSEDEDMEDGGAPLPTRKPGYTAPPSGVNRAIRRRFILIERERVKIKKNLGVPEGSSEKAEEVKQLLDVFTEKLDAKTAERETKKKDRKRREAARVHEKRGRHLEKTSMKERREKPKAPGDN